METSPAVSPTGLTDSNKTRLFTRINKLLVDYNQERKEKHDISTEQVEYERSKAELSFKPNINKSKHSYKEVVSSDARLKNKWFQLANNEMNILPEEDEYAGKDQ